MRCDKISIAFLKHHVSPPYVSSFNTLIAATLRQWAVSY